MSREDARAFSGTRSVARKLALQALYRWQLNDSPWQDLVEEFGEAEDMTRADADYFRTLVEGVWRGREQLDARLATFTDREPRRLDPVERAGEEAFRQRLRSHVSGTCSPRDRYRMQGEATQAGLSR